MFTKQYRRGPKLGHRTVSRGAPKLITLWSKRTKTWPHAVRVEKDQNRAMTLQANGARRVDEKLNSIISTLGGSCFQGLSLSHLSEFVLPTFFQSEVVFSVA
jgi:hypothetical protein